MTELYSSSTPIERDRLPAAQHSGVVAGGDQRLIACEARRSWGIHATKYLQQGKVIEALGARRWA